MNSCVISAGKPLNFVYKVVVFSQHHELQVLRVLCNLNLLKSCWCPDITLGPSVEETTTMQTTEHIVVDDFLTFGVDYFSKDFLSEPKKSDQSKPVQTN